MSRSAQRLILFPYTTLFRSEHIILKNCADGYILELKQVEIDLIKWEEVLDTLGNVDESTVALYENTMQLNRGMYLANRSEEHTSELQSRGHLVCRLLLETKK